MIVRVRFIDNGGHGQKLANYAKDKAIAGYETEDFKIQGRVFELRFSCSEQETEQMTPENLVKICESEMERLQERTNNYFEYSINVHNDNGLLHAHCLTSGLTVLSKDHLHQMKESSQERTFSYTQSSKAWGIASRIFGLLNLRGTAVRMYSNPLYNYRKPKIYFPDKGRGR
jgi:hypothetical protein